MTLTITIRVPAPTGPRGDTVPVAIPGLDRTADPAGIIRMLHTLLPFAEPAALLVAEASGLGLMGRIACAATIRLVRHAVAA